MAMIDSSNLVEFASRPRRMHQQTGRNYDKERGEKSGFLRSSGNIGSLHGL
ncbi:hypothetical protein DPMN_149138 [Dreissena polymorpha]|uniref:Uncharacterized protein n=1 Tax=Dreissena polymorpha TaxID=45954 RepID=A0A9D4J2Q8_DREPO|nr:hypothetical protein DPMN_147153 [Dreissena polymorpha]KAH3795583.1 hypothetical protein DPMN_149138 [Dreissena polymorpha]